MKAQLRSSMLATLLVCAGACTVAAAADDGPATLEDSLSGTVLPAPDFSPARSWGEPEDRPYWRRNLFRRFAGDQKFLVTTWWPAESKRWGFSLPLLAAVAGAAGSVDGGIDQRWQTAVEDWTGAGRLDAAAAWTRLGNSETALVLTGGSYLISRWAGNERMARASSLSAEALMSTALYSGLLKRATRRTRPVAGGTGAFFVERVEPGQLANSFPSGHAMGAFAVAAVFAAEYRERRWVPYVAYGAAGMIALSRVGLGRHYPSDVLAGAVLGQSLGRMVVHRAGGVEREPGWKRFGPMLEPGGNGVGLAYTRVW